MKKITSAFVITLALLVLPVGAVSTPGVGTIVDSSFTVGARKHVAYPFDVHPRGGRVYGKFRAEGGGGNDIECLILDEDGLVNYGNGHTVRSFYFSGRVTVATINVVLSEGRYYLVFNNSYSMLTPKAVAASIFIKLPNEQ